MLHSVQRASPCTEVRWGASECASCSLKNCLPFGLDDSAIASLERIVSHRRLHRDEALFQTGAPLVHLFVVRCGQFKSIRVGAQGQQQIVSFPMTGDIMGMDAIDAQRHRCSAIALEDSEVCEIPFAGLEALFVEHPELRRRFLRLMGDEIVRVQNVVLSLGRTRAERRLALFLVNLSASHAARGYSASRFQLRMSRAEIANYLGLTVESVSRLLGGFKDKGWIKVFGRELELLDRVSIASVASGNTEAEPIGSRVRGHDSDAGCVANFDAIHSGRHAGWRIPAPGSIPWAMRLDRATTRN